MSYQNFLEFIDLYKTIYILGRYDCEDQDNIYIMIIMAFVLLTGGMKYSHITWMCTREISCCEENIKFFSFYYKRIYGGKLTFTEADLGWSFSPSFKIFSITKVVKTVD